MVKFVIPAEGGDYVELAATKTGRLFRKQILPMNRGFKHPKNPAETIFVDRSFAEKLVSNFKAGYCPTVQFPMVNEKNEHVEAPDRNLGRVVDVEYDDSGVYAILDVKKHAEDVGETILGASAMLHLNYENTATGEKVGPTLLHVAATNRPYLTDLAPYEAVELSLSDTGSEELLLLTATDEEEPMTREELIAALKADHGIDVEALQARESQMVTALTAALTPAVESEVIELSAAEPNFDQALRAVGAVAAKGRELKEQVATLETENLELSNANEDFAQREAEKEVDGYIQEGRILPAQRDAMLELRLTNTEMFERLLPETALVELSERGVTTHDRTTADSVADAEAEAARYAERMKQS